MIAGLVRAAERAAVAGITVALYPTTWTLSHLAEFLPDINDDPAVVRFMQSLDEVMENTAEAFAQTS